MDGITPPCYSVGAFVLLQYLFGCEVKGRGSARGFFSFQPEGGENRQYQI